MSLFANPDWIEVSCYDVTCWIIAELRGLTGTRWGVSSNVLSIQPLQHVFVIENFRCNGRRIIVWEDGWALVFEVSWYGWSHFLMVQFIANVNGIKTFVSEVKFQKITSGSLFWRNCLNRLVQPKLSIIQNDCNQLIFRRIRNVCFCIHSFLLQRAKFSYRQLIQFGANMMKSLWLLYMWKESFKCDISMKIRTIVVSMSMTSFTSLRAAKEPHHIDWTASWAGMIPYRIYFVIATVWYCST